MSNQPDISVVVPVYQSVDSLRTLYERTAATLKKLNLTFEVVFVEDGVSENSWSTLQQINADYPDNARIIKLGKNFGQNAATLCGIHHATGQQIVTIDDDLQTPPEEIATLLAHQQQTGSDVVYGTVPKQKQGILRQLGSALIKRLFLWMDGSDIGTSFRLIGPGMKANLNERFHEHLFINQIIHWHTTDIGYVDVQHEPRADGQSGYSFFQLMAIAWRLVFYYTDWPLKAMSWGGMVLSIACFGFGSYYIYLKMTYGAELGFTSLIVSTLFATGVIMICLSILGRYINRIYTSRVNKPAYSIKAKK